MGLDAVNALDTDGTKDEAEMERNALKGTLLFALRWLDGLCDGFPWLARSRKYALKEKGQETTAQGPVAVLGGQPRGVRNREKYVHR